MLSNFILHYHWFGGTEPLQEVSPVFHYISTHRSQSPPNSTAFLPLPYLLFLFCFLNPVALYALEAIIRSEGHVPFSLAVQSSLNVGSYRQIDDTGWRIANRRRERETEHDIALGSVKVACGWTPELSTHYRVKLKILERDRAARATDFA
jgi:hypothetical protein